MLKNLKNFYHSIKFIKSLRKRETTKFYSFLFEYSPDYIFRKYYYKNKPGEFVIEFKPKKQKPLKDDVYRVAFHYPSSIEIEKVEFRLVVQEKKAEVYLIKPYSNFVLYDPEHSKKKKFEMVVKEFYSEKN